jgi:DNA-binding helix-hairpin-helix protein with protein kinase domain
VVVELVVVDVSGVLVEEDVVEVGVVVDVDELGAVEGVVVVVPTPPGLQVHAALHLSPSGQPLGSRRGSQNGAVPTSPTPGPQDNR